MKNPTLTTKEFVEKAKKLNTPYDFSLVDYKNTHTKVKIICPLHGVFEITPANFLQGRRCFNCAKNKQMTTQTFIEEAQKIHKEYDFSLVEYKNAHTKVKIICPIHGVFFATPANLLRNRKCRKCSNEILRNKFSLSSHQFVSNAKEIHPNYDFTLVEYVNNRTKVKIICPTHGLFQIAPTNFLCNVKGCPKCGARASKGEEFVAKWLQDNGYEFTPQKKFETCRNKKELPFDFHINNTNILIEYDGEQHFKSIKGWGGDKKLQVTIKKDNIKNEWVKNNNYIIIRLNYLMPLDEKLNALKIIKTHMEGSIK